MSPVWALCFPDNEFRIPSNLIPNYQPRRVYSVFVFIGLIIILICFMLAVLLNRPFFNIRQRKSEKITHTHRHTHTLNSDGKKNGFLSLADSGNESIEFTFFFCWTIRAIEYLITCSIRFHLNCLCGWNFSWSSHIPLSLSHWVFNLMPTENSNRNSTQ